MAPTQKDKFLKKEDKPKSELKSRKHKKSETSDNDKAETSKKPFDKKLYRLKKYSNKYKLQKWEEHHRKRTLLNYYKEAKSDPSIGNYKPLQFDDSGEIIESVGQYVRNPDASAEVDSEVKVTNLKKKAFLKAKSHYDQIKKEKEEKKQMLLKSKEERNAALELYRKKKAEKFKKLSWKTKRGQPVMSGRLEMLLDKIKASK